MKVFELIAMLKQYPEDHEVELDYGGTIMEIDSVFEKDEETIYIG